MNCEISNFLEWYFSLLARESMQHIPAFVFFDSLIVDDIRFRNFQWAPSSSSFNQIYMHAFVEHSQLREIFVIEFHLIFVGFFLDSLFFFFLWFLVNSHFAFPWFDLRIANRYKFIRFFFLPQNAHADFQSSSKQVLLKALKWQISFIYRKGGERAWEASYGTHSHICH